VIKGGGWDVVDLGVDVKSEKFLEAIAEHPGCAVGLSALLTTTMPSMKKIVEDIRSKFPETRIIIGGAPITKEFADRIGADAYYPDPQGAVKYLNEGE
jgi:methanogenic corrinoid protein MtbC1